MSRQAEAIRKFMAENRIKVGELAEAIGASPCAISNILAGRYNISKGKATKLAEVYGFDLNFLLTGEGSLFPSQSVNMGAIVNGGRVNGGINVTADLAAKDAEIAHLKQENERLWQTIQNLTSK